MIIRAWRWLRAAWMLRRLRGARRGAVAWQLQAHDLLARLAADHSRLVELQRLVAALADDAERDAAEVRDQHRQHVEVVDSLQSQLKIREDVELPLMAAINETNLQRYREEVRIQAMRLAAAGGRGPPEEV